MINDPTGKVPGAQVSGGGTCGAPSQFFEGRCKIWIINSPIFLEPNSSLSPVFYTTVLPGVCMQILGINISLPGINKIKLATLVYETTNNRYNRKQESSGLVTLCRKTTVQKATVQNATVQKRHSAEKHSAEKHSAEMGNVPIVLSSRVTEWYDVTTRNNQLNKTVLFG